MLNIVTTELCDVEPNKKGAKSPATPPDGSRKTCMSSQE